MKIRLQLGALAASLGLMFSAAAQADIKIGFSGVMSGPQASLGQDQLDGFMLGLELLGGKLGGQPAQVIVEDDQLKPDVGVQILQKFLEREKVDAVVGLGFSNVLMAQSRRIKDTGIPALSTNAGPAPLAGKMCMPNLFVMAWQNDAASEAMGQYAQNKGYKRAALITSNYQAGRDKLAGFKRFFKGEIVSEAYTQLGQLDYSAEISNIQKSNPDVIFAFYPGGAGVNFVRQMKQVGLMGKIPFLSDSMIDANTLGAMKNDAIGSIYGMHWGKVLDNAKNKAFVEAYQKRFKREPTEYAANAFDAANLLDAAVKKLNGNVSDRKAFVQAIKDAGSEFESVRGDFKFDKNNMPIVDYHALEVVSEGGDVGIKHLETVFKGHRDAYVGDCSL
ncbi:MAG: ABC transporter substrate-binding protein [Pigmentiphaga sp.]|nr:ABC transporter substrate-binding protein [Pigmentiphaga sp.]